MLPSVLIVDDERNTREGLRGALEENYSVMLAGSAEEAFNLMAAVDFDVVLTDLRMPGKSGLTVIDRALSVPSRPAVVMMTAYGNVDAAVAAMKRGATDFLTKPVNIERLEAVVRDALKKRSDVRGQMSEGETEKMEKVPARGGAVKKEKRVAEAEGNLRGMVGASKELKKVFERVRLVAPSKATVLVTGESGTGKELVAEAIHRESGRTGKFVAVHCAALSESLLESEIFGHEKGAFTGAVERRIGRFEAGDGGTLFLDEIGEIGAAVQVKLLRFLETKAVERVGGNKAIELDVRLVAATNRDLEGLVREGKFREDLFFRLNVVGIRLPALRDRAEDVPVLLRHYLDLFAKENAVETPVVEEGAMKRLVSYAWPGNIRELRNFAENAVVLKRGGILKAEDLEEKFWRTKAVELPVADGVGGVAGVGGGLSVKKGREELFREALERAGGNRTKAAELLGVSRRTLQRWLKEGGE